MLTTSVERLEGNLVKLTVTISADEVDASIAEAYKRVSGKVKLAGFRPGKAPRQVIDTAVGRDYVLADATEDLVNIVYPRALDAEMLRPIESPEMEEMDTVVEGEEFTFTADVIVRPELPLTSSDGLAVELPGREATDAEIAEQIDMARERFATLEPVEDRGVAADDFVLVSFTGTVDGEPYEGNVVDKYLYEMSRGLMPPEFDEGLMAATPGAEIHIEFEVPDNGSNDEYAGKTAGFDVVVHEIKSKKLPELNDEFASNVGYDSLEDLNADVRKRVEMSKGLSHDRVKERRLREALAERLEGEIPQSMIDSRKSQMFRDFMTMLEQRGIDMGQYLQSTGTDFETVDADITAQAAGSVREDLALEALFREKGLEVTDEDMEHELDVIAEATDTTVEAARQRWQDMGLIAIVREQVMQRKAYEWLLENVTITEVSGEPAESTEE